MSGCGSCRWWGRDEQGQPADGYGLSLQIPPGDGYGSLPAPGTAERDADWKRRESLAHSVEKLYHRCNRIPTAWDLEEADTDVPPLALTKDGSEFLAELWTRAEFGCALWEAG